MALRSLLGEHQRVFTNVLKSECFYHFINTSYHSYYRVSVLDRYLAISRHFLNDVDTILKNQPV